MFIGHLAKEGIAHTTIKVYLAAIHYLHVSVGMHASNLQSTAIPVFGTCHERDQKNSSIGNLKASASPLLPASWPVSTQY